jgi:hypothetical protein
MEPENLFLASSNSYILQTPFLLSRKCSHQYDANFNDSRYGQQPSHRCR